MALRTLGTNANNSLNALLFARAGLLPADLATFRANVKNDQVNGRPIFPGALEEGRLYIPNRGVLNILPGDYIAYDPTAGWPLLISAAAIASGVWTHS